MLAKSCHKPIRGVNINNDRKIPAVEVTFDLAGFIPPMRLPSTSSLTASKHP
jgi:hypothetical protein